MIVTRVHDESRSYHSANDRPQGGFCKGENFGLNLERFKVLEREPLLKSKVYAALLKG